MTTSEFTHLSNLQEQVLTSLISVHSDENLLADRMTQARAKIADEFMSGDLFPIWRILTRYYPRVNAIPDPTSFNEMLESASKLSLSDKVSLSAKYGEMAESEVSPAQFQIALIRLVERWRDEQYSQTLNNALQIHRSSYQDGDISLSGFDDSQVFLRNNIASLEKLSNLEDSFEGDINIEPQEVMKEYLAVKDGMTPGALTGFVELDHLTKGIQPGELALVIGFTSEGKSKVAYNIAYNVCYNQGLNVLFGTNEATRSQVRLNMLVRHSHASQFNHRRGLKYSDVVHGDLSPEDEETFKKVLYDVRHNKDHGKMYAFQLPSKASVAYLDEILYRQSKLYPVGLLVVDYLELMGSTKREDLNDMLVAVKRLAVEHKVPILSPWQVSREAWREAQKSGQYTKAATADTSQTERASDLMISILKPDDAPNTLKCQILKNRSGESGLQFTLHTDFSTGIVASQTAHNDLLEV